MSLTSRQHSLLLFIRDEVATKGVSPSFEEMKEHLGLRSKSGIHRLVNALEERGFIERLPNRARAIACVKEPGDPPRPILKINRASLRNFSTSSLLARWFGEPMTQPHPHSATANPADRGAGGIVPIDKHAASCAPLFHVGHHSSSGLSDAHGATVSFSFHNQRNS